MIDTKVSDGEKSQMMQGVKPQNCHVQFSGYPRKKFRIKKIKEFNYMFRNGKRQNGRCVTLIVTKSYKTYTRYGISISSKIGNAVTRNKVKRRIRACVHDITKNGLKIDKKNIIIVARSGIENMSYEEIYNTMEALLKKAAELQFKGNLQPNQNKDNV